MSRTISIAEAKATLSAHIRAVEHGHPVLITRHGNPVAALVSAEDYARIERLRTAGPEGGLASLAGGWEDSDDLVRILENASRPGLRETPALD